MLTSLEIEHRNEYLTEDKYYSIDIAVLEGTLGPQKLALEVDGPFHFASNTRAPLGTPLLLSTSPGHQLLSPISQSLFCHLYQFPATRCF